MTTQGNASPETVVPVRKTAADGRSVAHAIDEAAPELKVRLQEMVDTGKTHVTEWKGELQKGLRQRPIQSVLIAVAVGAAIGLIVGRRI